MSVRDLIPWNRERSQVPAVFRDDDARDPFLSLHREMNRLFDDVFRGFDSRLPPFGRTSAFGGGWNRQTVASTLMFLSAQSVSPPSLARGRQ